MHKEVVFHDGVAASESVFFFQPIEDPLGGVPLFPTGLKVNQVIHATLELRGRMYAELAQFVFPKRKSVEHSGSINAPDFNSMSPEQIAALEKASEILEANGVISAGEKLY